MKRSNDFIVQLTKSHESLLLESHGSIAFTRDAYIFIVGDILHFFTIQIRAIIFSIIYIFIMFVKRRIRTFSKEKQKNKNLEIFSKP